MEIPKEIKNDPKAIKLYKVAYGLILSNPFLKAMSSNKRMAWANGFVNGADWFEAYLQDIVKKTEGKNGNIDS